MAMCNPPHPGEFIKEVYLEPFGISLAEFAAKSCISISTARRLLNCKSAVNCEMALRLSKTLGRSPESWLLMQTNYHLWRARQTVNLDSVQAFDFSMA